MSERYPLISLLENEMFTCACVCFETIWTKYSTQVLERQVLVEFGSGQNCLIDFKIVAILDL